jgi:hypothetical protein
MVNRILLRSGDEILPIALDNPGLSDGWWAAERDAASVWRWTNGSAELPKPVGAAILEVSVAQTLPYVLAADHADATMAMRRFG